MSYQLPVRLIRKAALIVLAIHPGAAQAHFSLLAPPSALQTDNGGKGAPPCGEGVDSSAVTQVTGGHPLPLRLQEFVFHPGHYRLALSVNSRAELPPDPVVVEADGASISAAIQSPAKIPILSDGLFAHANPPTGDWRAEITLPNLNCDKCTLQITEFMAEHGAPFFYHHCADLKIVADPALPPADAAWPRSSNNAMPTSAALPHIADGGGWKTSITLVNLDTAPAAFTLNFRGDNGAPLELTLAGLGKLSTVTGTIQPGGAQTISTDGSPPTVSTGWAQLSSPQLIDGNAVFRLETNGQEASVPFQLSGARKLVLPFESGPGLALGIALANISPTDDTTISVTLRNERGEVIDTAPAIQLAHRQHTSFVLAVPPASSPRGTVEFDSASADLFALGIRSNNGAFTSIRALAK